MNAISAAGPIHLRFIRPSTSPFPRVKSSIWGSRKKPFEFGVKRIHLNRLPRDLHNGYQPIATDIMPVRPRASQKKASKTATYSHLGVQRRTSDRSFSHLPMALSALTIRYLRIILRENP